MKRPNFRHGTTNVVSEQLPADIVTEPFLLITGAASKRAHKGSTLKKFYTAVHSTIIELLGTPVNKSTVNLPATPAQSTTVIVALPSNIPGHVETLISEPSVSAIHQSRTAQQPVAVINAVYIAICVFAWILAPVATASTCMCDRYCLTCTLP